MDKLQLLHGPDIESSLSGGGVKVYTYVLNKPGLYLLLGMAGVLYLFSAWAWLGGMAVTWVWKASVIVALVVASALSILVTYYNNFAGSNFVAMSDDALFVGSRDRAWSIAWELLDIEKLGLKEMELSKASGKLDIHVGGQHIKLLLYSPFALLGDPQEFMFNLLARFSDLSAEELAAAVEEPEESDAADVDVAAESAEVDHSEPAEVER